MEPSIHIFAKGDKNPLEFYRQVPNVKRLVVDFGGVPGQQVEQSWIAHILNSLNEVELGIAVVESFVISNAIKLELPERDAHIEAFRQTLRNFAAVMRRHEDPGPYRICYDFMGPENWWRNLLAVRDEQDRVCVGYDPRQPEPTMERLDNKPRLGYPESYTPKQHAHLLALYKERGETGLWHGLEYFLKAVIPVAEEENILMGIHPDDPAFNVRGRPRIIKDQDALERVIRIIPSPSNGITFCPGSLATNRNNDLIAITNNLWTHFVFCHFRNIRFLTPETLDGECAFLETYHEDTKGIVPLAALLKILHTKGCTVPFRADHAPGMYGQDSNFGYGLIARAQGLSYLNGILQGLACQ